MSRSLFRIAGPLVVILLVACGGGGGTGVDPAPPPSATIPSVEPVSVRFGLDNIVKVVAGDPLTTLPVEIVPGRSDVRLAVANGPSFVTIDGLALKVDPTALIQASASHDLTITVLDSAGKELGRQAGTVLVSAVTSSAAAAPLANGGSIELPEVGLRIEAPSGTFDSGSATITVDKTVDAAGRLSTRVLLSEANRQGLRLSSLTATTSHALSLRERPLGAGAREVRSVACTGSHGDLLASQGSVADGCIRGWVQSTAEISCLYSWTTAISTSSIQLRTVVNFLPSWDQGCGTSGQIANIRDTAVWSKLSGPKDWNTRNWNSREALINAASSCVAFLRRLDFHSAGSSARIHLDL